jgi:hypothetical protein
MSSSGFFEKLGYYWCRFAHDQIRWPVRGRYQCARCWRYHVVRWEQTEQQNSSELRQAVVRHY